MWSRGARRKRGRRGKGRLRRKTIFLDFFLRTRLILTDYKRPLLQAPNRFLCVGSITRGLCSAILRCASLLPFGHVEGTHPTLPQHRHSKVGALSPRRPPRAAPRAVPRPPRPPPPLRLSGGLSGGLGGMACSSLRSRASSAVAALSDLAGLPGSVAFSISSGLITRDFA